MPTTTQGKAPAPDFVDRMIAQWDRASPPRTQFREQEAILRLMRMGGILRRELDEIAAAAGLVAGPAQALVTLRWYEPEPTTPKQVMAATSLTSGAVTAVLDKLEGRELLRRDGDPADRRGTLLRLTERGRQVADRIIADQLDRNEQWLDVLSIPERATLSGLLRKLIVAAETPRPKRTTLTEKSEGTAGKVVFQAISVSEFD
ncbi:MAG: winged helix DNA-binding protein [Opitutaceae bacterium]|nr:winged helix DNA-binding protein [Opitutaceae bacterium]